MAVIQNMLRGQINLYSSATLSGVSLALSSGNLRQEEVWECHLPIQLVLGGKSLATV